MDTQKLIIELQILENSFQKSMGGLDPDERTSYYIDGVRKGLQIAKEHIGEYKKQVLHERGVIV